MTPSVTLTIDGKTVQVEKGQMILDAAGQNQVSIPRLCAYPGLAPFAACRMCVVEVEGMRGFPAACSTPVAEGMVVRTQTPGVQALRRQTLQLMLSEHPSNCLFCEETLDCGAYMATLRKGETVTGCKSCPKDGQCELQDVVQWVGLDQVGLPVHYRDLPVEKFDPFYDRDYNLCILCGRCVRVCQDVRLADVLTFKQRGQATVIGPAYERSHLEAGCEFCGDCVAACPTGALSEKTLKWAGKWEKEVETTCPLCSLGCQIRLLVKGDEVMGSLPVEGGQLATQGQLATPGQLCVKGRFSAYELLNNPQRLHFPSHLQEGIDWDEAVELAAKKLAACPPDKFALRVSPDCTNEDLYIAQKFARQVMKMPALGGFPESGPYSLLLDNGGLVASLAKASAILTVGLDGRFGWSVVGLELKRAVRHGARLFMMLPEEPHLANFAESWLPLDGQALLGSLQELLRLAGLSPDNPELADPTAAPELAELASALREAVSPVIVAGPTYLDGPLASQVARVIADLAARIGASVLPLAPQANLAGARQVERLFEPLPVSGEMEGGAESPQVLYLIGETPVVDDPQAGFIIYQNFAAFEGERLPDLTLPSAAFAEVDGSLTNLEGQRRDLHQAVPPPGEALPDWTILCRIAQKMGYPGFDYPDAAAIRREIEELLEIHRGDTEITEKKKEINKKREESDSRIEISKSSHNIFNRERISILDSRVPPLDSYRGLPLSTWVEGLRSIEDL